MGMVLTVCCDVSQDLIAATPKQSRDEDEGTKSSVDPLEMGIDASLNAEILGGKDSWDLINWHNVDVCDFGS